MKKLLAVLALGILFASQKVEAQTIDISIDASGTPITDSVTAYCYDSNWAYYSVSDDVEDDGIYSIGPVSAGSFTCYSYCSTWPCDFAGSPQSSVVVAEGDTSVPASLSFTAKDKTIRVSVTAGSTPLTSDISVSCSGQTSPWGYDSVTTVDEDGTYHCSVTAGDIYVSASCSVWPCDYSGYPNTTVTVAEGDTTVDASLSFSAKDKTISVALQTTGGTAVTSEMTVYCSEQGGSWSYESSSTVSESGTYDLAVGAGNFYCYAYCSNYSDCSISGNDSAYVTVAESDSTVSVTLDGFLANSATLSGTITDGTSGVANVWVSINSYSVASSAESSKSSIWLLRSMV